MKCAICDKTLSPDEVQWSQDHKEWEPCGECLMAISEVFNDDSDEEIVKQVEEEWWQLYEDDQTLEKTVE